MSEQALESLDVIGVSEGTDKSSLVADYLRSYDEWFTPLRRAKFNMIEIGVFRGASTRMWRRYFEDAGVIGVDVDPKCRQHATDGIQIEIGSQNDPDFLHRLAAKHPPLIVIDDGSHRSDDIIFTFERLYPALQPGGWYVIEDLHFHMNPREVERLRGHADRTAAEYVTSLMNDRMRGQFDSEGLTGIRRYIVEATSSISVIPGAVAFRKADGLSNEHLNGLRTHLESSVRWEDWCNYAYRLRERGRPWNEYIQYIQRAVALEPSNYQVHERLSQAYDRVGDAARAADTLEAACRTVALDPYIDKMFRDRIAAFRSR